MKLLVMNLYHLIDQTGSGKTYTIWGASNALLEDEQQGLAPRVFRRLFERIAEVVASYFAAPNLSYMVCSYNLVAVISYLIHLYVGANQAS